MLFKRREPEPWPARARAATLRLEPSAVWKPLVEPMLVGAVPLGLAASAGYVAVRLAARSVQTRRTAVPRRACASPGASPGKASGAVP